MARSANPVGCRRGSPRLRAAFGHRRLSIIDVSEAANQPLWDHSQRFAIIFNGEIYNYRELKDQYPAYPYRTQADSEVILAYYEKYGTDFLNHLNGMFGLAIWDSQDKSLLIARDRVGEKPVFYFADEKQFQLPAGTHKQWQDPNDRFHERKRPTHPPKFMVWGAIGYYFKTSLVFCKQNKIELCRLFKDLEKPSSTKNTCARLPKGNIKRNK